MLFMYWTNMFAILLTSFGGCILIYVRNCWRHLRNSANDTGLTSSTFVKMPKMSGTDFFSTKKMAFIWTQNAYLFWCIWYNHKLAGQLIFLQINKNLKYLTPRWNKNKCACLSISPNIYTPLQSPVLSYPDRANRMCPKVVSTHIYFIWA